MTAHAHLAIDLGADSGRAVIGVLDGDRLELHEVHRFENSILDLPSGLHWGVGRLYRSVLDGLRGGASWCRDNRIPLVSVGVDTWGVDFALVGASGEMLHLPRAYRDPGNQPAMERVIAKVGREAIYDATGIEFLPFNTLYQIASQFEREPAMVRSAARILFMPDLMHFLLTGAPVNETTIASTSQMIDPRTRTWAKPLIERAGLPTHFLRDLIEPGTRIGSIRPVVAQQTGAPVDLSVIAPAGHDTACAVAAVPARDHPNWAFVSSGTWSCLGAEIESPCMSHAARDSGFTNEGGVGGTIRFLKNLTGLWLVQECRRQWESEGRRFEHDDLVAQAEAAAPFRTRIPPDHPSFMQPGHMVDKIGAIARELSQANPESPGQVVRCCLEAIADSYRATLEQLERVLGRRFAVLHIVGGGGRNRLLNQLAADATRREVVVGPFEATATGNVLIQAMGAGTVRDRHHLRSIVAATVDPQVYHPRAAWRI